MIGLGYWEPPSGEEGGRVLCWNSLMQILEAHTLVTLGGGYNTPLDESEDKGLRRLNIFPNSSSKLVQSQGLIQVSLSFMNSRTTQPVLGPWHWDSGAMKSQEVLPP